MTRTPAQRAQLAAAQKQGALWHSTPEGREAARRGALAGWAIREDVTQTCERCGNEYSTPYPDRSRFCSARCRHAVAEKTGKLNVTVPCPVCGTAFEQNRYKHTPATCGRICGQRLRAGRK